MTTPDGSFSPHLWVQRVMEGVAEQESISSGSPSPVSSFMGSSGYSPSPASKARGSPQEAPGSRYSTPTQPSPSSYYSSSYTPPFIPSPTRHGSWASPKLPPQGFKKSWDVVLEIMQ
mmetsp:Transcript_5319/g.14823  ORF Transcript_5319/g.14823 Transcript_5319/m.14823 type:complete len:117 (+) Transcript_5319:245-595(+)